MTNQCIALNFSPLHIFSVQVIQKLVFPFSRMSYRPANEAQFFSKLEMVLELKALSSPLATVNILMSLFQLGHFPGLVLHRVFSPSFISNVTSELEFVITECLF